MYCSFFFVLLLLLLSLLLLFLVCQHGSTMYNTCGDRCTCNWGRLVNCVRIRKEFTSLTPSEREQYITIIKTASTHWRYKRAYDTLINTHYHLFRGGIHEQTHFLPWHRWFILQYENLLRRVNCKFTVAYWDWSIVARDPWNTANQKSLWNSGNSGFGGNGIRWQGCVQSGPFRQGQWSRVSPRGPRCLTRAFNGNPPDSVAVQEVIDMNDFNNFETTLRGVLHDGVHGRIGGIMNSLESASAPEFFLHHGFIDKIWDEWQKRSWSNRFAFFPQVRQLMPGTRHLPSEFIHLSYQPGNARVEYQSSNSENRVMARLGGKTPNSFVCLPRLKLLLLLLLLLLLPLLLFISQRFG